MADKVTDKFLLFVHEVKETKWEFENLKPYVVAQAMLECGRGITKLFIDFNNPFGMHYHDFLSDIAKPVSYEACDGVADYACFTSLHVSITAYFRWFSYWEHYGNWKVKAKDGKAFLDHIGPHFCPPGFTDAWKKEHGGLNYSEYICKQLLPEARLLLSSSQPILKASWFEMNRTDDGKPMVTAYDADKPVFTHPVTTIKDLSEWCGNFEGAQNLLVADTSKAIPQCPDIFEDESEGAPMPLPTVIPFARQFHCGMKVQGKYPKRFPEGLIVHFTAGRGEADDTQEYCASKGYTLLTIGKAGDLVQSSPIDSWGYHCGNKYQETHIGVEIVNAGRLEKKADGTFWSWFGTQISKENVRYMADTEHQIEGYYEIYTEEQEATLIHLCEWLHDNSNGIFSYDNVIGHDESCSMTGNRGRKNDPGSALSVSMPEFRKLLKKRK